MKRIAIPSTLIFSLILSACGGGGGGVDDSAAAGSATQASSASTITAVDNTATSDPSNTAQTSPATDATTSSPVASAPAPSAPPSVQAPAGPVTSAPSTPAAGATASIDQIIADMSSKSEAIAIDPRFEWQQQPAIVMHAPRGDAIPSWWTGNRPEWTHSVLTWFTTQEAQGNAATNTRVQVANLRFYILSESTRTWKQHDVKADPYSEMWKYPFAYAGAGSPRGESSGGVSVKPVYPNFYHGYGNSISIDPKDVRAVYVSMDFRLAVDNTSKPDDRASAKYVVNAGADYWPGNGQATWSLGYAPGIGTGRTMLASKDWRTATLLVPNKNYGSTMDEIRKNPPPLK